MPDAIKGGLRRLLTLHRFFSEVVQNMGGKDRDIGASFDKERGGGVT